MFQIAKLKKNAEAQGRRGAELIEKFQPAIIDAYVMEFLKWLMVCKISLRPRVPAPLRFFQFGDSHLFGSSLSRKVHESTISLQPDIFLQEKLMGNRMRARARAGARPSV